MTPRRTARHPASGLLRIALLALLLPCGLTGQQEPDPPVRERPEIDSPFRWIERGFRVGPYLGWWSADRGTLEFGPGSTAAFGGRFRARVSSPLSIEGGLGIGSSDRFVIDPRLESGPAAVDTVDSVWGRVEAGVQVALTGARTWNSLQPYGLLGGGLIVGLDEEDSAALEPPDDGGDGDGFDGDGEVEDPVADLRYDVGTSPFFQVGLGVEWKPAGRLGIGLEVRDQLVRLTAPDGFFDPEILERIQELDVEAPQEVEWTHHIELSVGLWYYF